MKFLGTAKFLIGLLLIGTPLFSQGIIIDHTCTEVSKIPDAWIAKVKSMIKLHYAHTSHGGQLTSGIERLVNPSLPVHDSRLTYVLQYGFLPKSPHLCIMDGQLSNTYVTPDLYWENGGDTYTKAALNAYPAINVSMWALCRQLDYYSEAEVNNYLLTMSKLEQAYPGVTFVYMTGNAQAVGAEGYNRHLRNEQIRKFCRVNNKVLFDFADLDAWCQRQKATYFYSGTEVPKEHPAYKGDECMHACMLPF